ncbi:integrase [Chitinophaga sp. YR573]|uniref:site-specific integrase n=1 Tax=Chitinophaga sp. YR573 TaxID=1881040 RepID=UPI0008B0CCD6|nr:site-specific integrase [Chitinophaga sp. YR573]SEW35718.1 integrase [Chitinophaga sp. YR573]
MGYTKKGKKGEISISNHRGRIMLRWRYNGERYPLSLPYDYCPENMHHATLKVAEINLDIMKGCFDTSLEKYKPEKPKPAILLPLEEEISPPTVIYLNSLTSKFNDWTKQIRNMNIDLSVDYLGIRKMLERWVNVPLEDVAAKMATEKLGATTYNRRLSFLCSFFSWLLSSGVITINPLLHVSKRRHSKKKKSDRRKPLTEDEIFIFLEAIRKNTFCHKSSPFKHSHYYPFLKFIFHTGVRNAESIGLKVKHIDFTLGQIEISEAFARTPKGTNHAARISKGTKIGNIRYLPLTDDLSTMLLPLVQNREPDSFVFLSPKGMSIDDRMLQKRILKPILIKLSIGNRDLYAGRHSFGTRAVQQGMTITDVAYLMGHSTVETTIRNYVSTAKPAVSLPTINKKSN